MQCKRRSEKGKKSDLDHCVVEYLIFANIGLFCISILELSSDSGISDCYCDSTSKDSAGLEYYSASNPSLRDIGVSRLDQISAVN